MLICDFALHTNRADYVNQGILKELFIIDYALEEDLWLRFRLYVVCFNIKYGYKYMPVS